MFKKYIVLVIVLIVLMCPALGFSVMTKTADFVDNTDGTTTIAGTSVAIKVRGAMSEGNVEVPLTIQIHAASGLTCAIQGVVATADADFADASTKWQVFSNGTVTADGFVSIAVGITHIRINATAGSCKASILY